MNDNLIEAFFSAPHTVLGRRLKPFTLRHAFVLAAGDNHITDGGEIIVGDLYQAVEVCAREGNYFLDDGEPSKLKRAWWQWRVRKMRIDKELLKFNRYIEDYSSPPKVWSSGSNTKESACHWIISTVAGLMKHLSMSKDEAWSESPGSASWYLAAAIDADPMMSIDLMTESEDKAVRAMAEMED